VTPLLLAMLLAAAPTPAAYEAEARRLEAALIAPCCWRQQVSVHSSPAADQIRTEIRTRLAAGEAPALILASYEERYGTAILAEPPARGSNWILYLVPPIVLVASGGLLVFVVRRFSRTSPGALPARPGEAEPPGDERIRQALEDELADLD
jgi:cytochrome c-type biogenesis protein CcmH